MILNIKKNLITESRTNWSLSKNVKELSWMSHGVIRI